MGGETEGVENTIIASVAKQSRGQGQ